jgi:hypothetical protein
MSTYKGNRKKLLKYSFDLESIVLRVFCRILGVPVNKTHLFLIGDAPPLISSGTEPISGLTASQIVAESIAIDPVQVIAVNVGSLVDNALQSIVDSTGGTVLGGAGNLIDTLSNIIDVASKQPFAWFGFAIAGKIGIPIVFDAQGSFDPQGLPILLYEWDFDGDGGFDLETTTATVTWTYDAAFDGFVILRVTSEGGTALASARTVINEAGSVSQGDEEPCDLDENGFSIIVGDNNTFLNCNPTNLPTTDKPGVRKITGTISIETAVANVKAAVSGLSPPAFGEKGKTIAKQVDANNYAGACDSLNGLVRLTNAQTKKKINKGKMMAKQVDANKGKRSPKRTLKQRRRSPWNKPTPFWLQLTSSLDSSDAKNKKYCSLPDTNKNTTSPAFDTSRITYHSDVGVHRNFVSTLNQVSGTMICNHVP